MDLFKKEGDFSSYKPLAERVRPRSLEEFSGQEHLLGEKGLLGELFRQGVVPSMIFWGEPGCGKTTLARLIARRGNLVMKELSAVESGVKDLRGVIDFARAQSASGGYRTILFIDEIHRYSKSQQDALLHAVEDGTITLIGATTENPSFEVIPPLLSRARVIKFEPLNREDLLSILDRVLEEDEALKSASVELEEEAREILVKYSGGDARIMLNALEIAVELTPAADGGRRVVADTASRALQRKAVYHDKKGDYHYDLASAFIKSMRASDPDAALFYMAKMLTGGEDPKFIARRMVILASEDIGNANPFALTMAVSCFEAVSMIGMPEARIILGQTCAYLASSPKSNAAYKAISEAMTDAAEHPDAHVPLKLRNPVTSHMKAWGYGKDYTYPHSQPEHFFEENLMPEGLEDKIYYRPTDQGSEKSIKERLEKWWSKRRNRKS